MKAAETNLLEFFKQTIQMTIPDPQRRYHWTEEQCRKLWDDILRVAGDNSIDSYFIGTIVYIEYGIVKRTPVPKLILLDGQQRLITISLLLAALSEVDKDTGQTSAGHKEINDLFLFNNQERGEFHCKMVPSQFDRDTFFSLINNDELPLSDSNGLIKNYWYFKNKIIECGIDTDIVYKGIAKLAIMDISTDRVYENPELICENLDSTGLDEEQTDLVRNWLGLLRSAS